MRVIWITYGMEVYHPRAPLITLSSNNIGNRTLDHVHIVIMTKQSYVSNEYVK